MRQLIAINDASDFGGPSLFLGGGITGCWDWQAEMVGLLDSTDLTLINPRRPDFPMGDPEAGRIQILWEHKYLVASDAVLFWFPEETLCPITLYELGTWSKAGKTLFVGTHPGYARSLDVDVQLSLVRPEVKVVRSLADLAEQVKDWEWRNSMYVRW